MAYKRYPTNNYNLRKRSAAASNASFNDIESSDDEKEKRKSVAKKKSKNDKTYKVPVDSSSSSEDSKSSNNDESSDDENEDFAEYINVKRQKMEPGYSAKNQTINSSFFRLLKHYRLGKVNIKLFIFTPGRKPLCNEFTWQKGEKRFECMDCKIKADLCKNENGKTIVQLSAPKHPCPPRLYNPQKFEHKIIKRPNFEIVEYQTHDGVLKRKLHVFESSNPEMGYEYIWDQNNSEFRCGPCASRRCVRAKAFKDQSGEECIQLGKNEHVCIQRSLTNASREKRTISDANFEIFTNGKKRNLFVFDSEDRKQCYKYYWSSAGNVFICNGCRARDYYVYARLKADDEKTLILGDTNHVCPLLDYEPPKDAQNLEEITSGFEYFTYKNDPPKIFLFLDDEKKECYEFAAIRHHNEYSDKFLCIGCNGSSVRPRVIAKLLLCKNPDDNLQVSLKILQPQHTCIPRKYEPKKYEKKVIKSPNLLFCKYKDEISTKLILFHPEGQLKRCYMYGLNREFQCVQCRKKKKFLTAKVVQDESGKECAEMKFFDHCCKRLKWNGIIGDCQILKRSGLFKRKKIIKTGGFEFRKNDSRSESGYLYIFDKKDKNLCFEFRRDPRTRLYYCIKCKEMNHQITAKLSQNQENIEVEGEKHVCEAQPYEPLENIVEPTNYKVFQGKNGNDNLAIFTSTDKKMGYKYGYVKDKKAFVCYACREQRPAVFARICRKFNGEEYLQLCPTKHICEPKKLNLH